MPLFIQFLQNLYNRGNEYFDHPVQIRRNVIINRIVLLFIPLSACVMIVFGVMYAMLLERDGGRYSGYFYYFAWIPALNLTLTTGAYLFRHKIGYPEATVIIVTIIGFVDIGIAGLMIGPEAGIHYYLLVSLTLALYFFELEQRNILFGTLIAIAVTLYVFMYFTYEIDPPFPIPADLAELGFQTMIVFFVVTFIYVSYTFWYEFGISEKRALGLNEELSTANERLIEKDQEYQYELELAAELQQSFLPPANSQFGDARIEYTYLPLGKVSGDQVYFLENGSYSYILLWDVSGHGVPAALTSMIARDSFEKYIKEQLTPAEVFHKTNIELSQKIKTQEYLTAFLIRASHGSLLFSSASHPPAAFLRRRTGQVETIDQPGLLIGVFEQLPEDYHNGTVSFQKGDRIVIYTDGFVEQKNPEGEMFTEQRLLDWMGGYQKEKPQADLNEFHTDLMDFWTSFAGSKAPEDDVTVISIEFTA